MTQGPRIRLGTLPQRCPPEAPSWFSGAERARWDGLGTLRKPAFLGSRQLMRGLLCDELGPASWQLDGRGHPFLASSDIKTSLSHHAARTAVALCRNSGGLGIDLERPQRRCQWQKIAQRWFAPTEQALLADLGPEEGERLFYRLWTLKEAWVKATGRGLAGNFQALRAEAGRDDGLDVLADASTTDWHAWSGWVGGDCLGVVWRAPSSAPPRLETARLGPDGVYQVQIQLPDAALQRSIRRLVA